MRSNLFKSVVSNIPNAVVVRIMPGTDLVQGIEAVCRQHEVTSGTILSGIGSLQRASFVYVVPDEQAPSGAAYIPPTEITGPLELLCLQGTVGLNADQAVSVHLHGTMFGSDCRVCGGHLISGGNPVLASAEVMICATLDVAWNKTYDDDVGFELFDPRSSKRS